MKFSSKHFRSSIKSIAVHEKQAISPYGSSLGNQTKFDLPGLSSDKLYTKKYIILKNNDGYLCKIKWIHLPAFVRGIKKNIGEKIVRDDEIMRIDVLEWQWYETCPVAGTLEEIYVNEGDPVIEGDFLYAIRLDRKY